MDYFRSICCEMKKKYLLFSLSCLRMMFHSSAVRPVVVVVCCMYFFVVVVVFELDDVMTTNPSH